MLRTPRVTYLVWYLMFVMLWGVLARREMHSMLAIARLACATCHCYHRRACSACADCCQAMHTVPV